MVYIINKKGSNQYKIGRSINPQKRLKTLQTGNADELILIKTFECIDDRLLERQIHDKLRPRILNKQSKKKGEWFVIDPNWLNVIIFEIVHRLLD